MHNELAEANERGVIQRRETHQLRRLVEQMRESINEIVVRWVEDVQADGLFKYWAKQLMDIAAMEVDDGRDNRQAPQGSDDSDGNNGGDNTADGDNELCDSGINAVENPRPLSDSWWLKQKAVKCKRCYDTGMVYSVHDDMSFPCGCDAEVTADAETPFDPRVPWQLVMERENNIDHLQRLQQQMNDMRLDMEKQIESMRVDSALIESLRVGHQNHDDLHQRLEKRFAKLMCKQPAHPCPADPQQFRKEEDQS